MQIMPFGPIGSPYGQPYARGRGTFSSGMFAPQSQAPRGGNQAMPFANANEADAAQPTPFQPPYMDGPNPDGSGGYRLPPQPSFGGYMDGPGPNGRGGYMPPWQQGGSQAPRGGAQMMPGDSGGYSGGNKLGYGDGSQYMTNGDAGFSRSNPTAGAQAPGEPSPGVMNQDMSGGTPVPKIGNAGMFAQQGQPGANNMFTGDTNAFNPNRSVSDIYSRYGVQDMVGHGGKWWDNAIQTGQAKGSDLEAALQREGFKNNFQRVPQAPPYTPPQIGPMPQGGPLPLAPQNTPPNMGWWGQAGANPQWQQLLDARAQQWNPWASPWGK